jgi:hypothetical protein
MRCRHEASKSSSRYSVELPATTGLENNVRVVRAARRVRMIDILTLSGQKGSFGLSGGTKHDQLLLLFVGSCLRKV